MKLIDIIEHVEHPAIRSYLGNCVNSFDRRTGESLIDCFETVSDFALQLQTQTELSSDEFYNAVGNIPQEVQEHISPPRGVPHSLKYFYLERGVYILYDVDKDRHYFFK